VIGLLSPSALRRNSEAQPGDAHIDEAALLTKPLGVGVYSAAIKKGALAPEAYREMIEVTTRLNVVGADLAQDPLVHAITDVTGFGLLGPALEMARGASKTVNLRLSDLPLRSSETLVQAGFATGASGRNWASYCDAVSTPPGLAEWRRRLLTDPQTSGGLLVSCDAGAADAICGRIRAAGNPEARVTGNIAAGAPSVVVLD
jgi:selenide,water dikinase